MGSLCSDYQGKCFQFLHSHRNLLRYPVIKYVNSLLLYINLIMQVGGDWFLFIHLFVIWEHRLGYHTGGILEQTFPNNTKSAVASPISLSLIDYK